MENTELQMIWKSYDQKLENVLAINKEMALHLSRQKLNKQIGKLYRPKWTAIIIGVPYTLLLMSVVITATLAKAYLVALGFGVITLIMTVLIALYVYQVYLISRIRGDEEVLSTQYQLSRLKISSFRSLNLAVFQLPFWSVCWISIDALKESPFLYGGVNLLIFMALCFLSYWIYNKMNYKNEKSKLRDFFLSGNEWQPILKSAEILEQIKGYKQ